MNSALSNQGRRGGGGKRILCRVLWPGKLAFLSTTTDFLLLHSFRSLCGWPTENPPLVPESLGLQHAGELSQRTCSADHLVDTSFRLQQKLPVCPQMLIRWCPHALWVRLPRPRLEARDITKKKGVGRGVTLAVNLDTGIISIRNYEPRHPAR